MKLQFTNVDVTIKPNDYGTHDLIIDDNESGEMLADFEIELIGEEE